MFIGFLYDREWVLIDNNGSYLNQKKVIVLFYLIFYFKIFRYLAYV